MVAVASSRSPLHARRAAFIWGPRMDVAVFGGSAALALALVALAPKLSDPGGALPPWGWLLFVVAIDVAHVHTTLYRTYFDREEVARRRALYIGVPIACYIAGAALHLASERWFWRALAYVAVAHFVRQQVGWVAIYRARAGERARLDRRLDAAVIYAATGWPLLYWHAHLPRAFRWFVEGDFQPAPWLVAALPALAAVYAALLLAYVVRSVQLAARGPVNLGKHLVIATTAATWYVGIVATNSDFEFTVANVIVHGVPYAALIWAYSRERSREAPRSLVARIVSGGLFTFLAVVLVLAFAEEVLWDRLIWHDRPLFFFGGSEREAPLLGPLARALVVPLLALPQATHYMLDALLWRRKDTGPAQARALGFRGAPSAGPSP